MSRERTVQCRPECFLEGLDHKYFVEYLVKGEEHKSELYPSFQKAFDEAINFANQVNSDNKLSDMNKRNIIKSISVIDEIGNEDVTTAELKNILLNIIGD